MFQRENAREMRFKRVTNARSVGEKQPGDQECK